MAKMNGNDYSVVVNSVDISDHVTAVGLSRRVQEIESSACSDTNDTFIAGSTKNEMSLTVQNDFADSDVWVSLAPIVGTLKTVVLKPTSGSVTTNNPSFTFQALLSQFDDLGGSRNALDEASYTWPISGAITTAYS